MLSVSVRCAAFRCKNSEKLLVMLGSFASVVNFLLVVAETC